MLKRLSLFILCVSILQTVFLKNLSAAPAEAPKPAVGPAPVPSDVPLPIRKPRPYKPPFKSMCGFFDAPYALYSEGPLEFKIDLFLVSKRLRKLVVFTGPTALKEYHVSLGWTPEGHKVKQFDGKTPEGQYIIEDKNPGSRYRKSLQVSYPNAADIANAKALGVDPGGDIMIHGESNKPENVDYIRKQIAEHGRHDWTWGCVAVRNEEIDEIYAKTELRTSIEICP